MTASLGIRVIRSSLVDWRSMKKECRHARHTTIPSIEQNQLAWVNRLEFKNQSWDNLFTIFQSFTPSVFLSVQMKKPPSDRQYLVLRGCLKTLIKLIVKWSKKPNQVVVLTWIFSRETFPFPSSSRLANCSHKAISLPKKGLEKVLRSCSINRPHLL